MSLIEEWYRSMPPVTRTYITLAVLTTASVGLDAISPYKLYINWDSVVRLHQYWRLVTAFLYFGSFNLDFLFHMFFLYRYCKLLELNAFRGRTADFATMLLFGAAFLLALSPAAPSILFLGPSLTFMMVYVWARRNEHQAMNLLGLFNFRAPYLPWVLLVFSVLLGSPPVIDLMGILAGHVYYFLVDVYPVMVGIQLLRTPRLLVWAVGGTAGEESEREAREAREAEAVAAAAEAAEAEAAALAAAAAAAGGGEAPQGDGPRGGGEAGREPAADAVADLAAPPVGEGGGAGAVADADAGAGAGVGAVAGAGAGAGAPGLRQRFVVAGGPGA
ncbi:hypothetical protein I4F81_008967 [Pyropia yezoensis]|uniref:Uncharacterized protein n=1 Tax=Pyropia yezoensis TaxID=2788 RepID=A0ACC3C9K4_PYRYE|nr:hypothetical protein I4F81_008967 [Neopyropia yezoensis]